MNHELTTEAWRQWRDALNGAINTSRPMSWLWWNVPTY